MSPYFSRDPSTWSIIDFLNQCDDEKPFYQKINYYIKSLQEIVASDQAGRQECAGMLLDSYKKESKVHFYRVLETKKWPTW